MKWVALLRGVNLGARNKVPMAELRTLLADAGYGNVRTYIASGNVLLEGPAARKTLGSDLERLIAGAFGVQTAVILRKQREFAATVEQHPFKHTADTHVAFLAERPTKAAAATRTGGRGSSCPDGFVESNFGGTATAKVTS